jgi:biotin operon repressor
MKIKSIVFAVASTLSMTALAENTSVDSAEIQKAIQLLENKGYQIDSPPNEAKKSSTPTLSLKSYQAGTIDAFVSGAYGRTKYKGDLSSDATTNTLRDNSYNIRGSFAYQDPSKLGVQFDAVYSQDKFKSSKMTTLDLAGHGFYRNDKFLVGLFGQYKQPKIHSDVISTGLDGSDDAIFNAGVDVVSRAAASDQVFFGGEAQGYFGDLTLTGQIARQEFVNQKDVSSDLNFGKLYKHGRVASAKADYFINNNWRVTGGFSYNTVDMLANVSSDTKKYSLSSEYRLDNYPVSFYADYTRNKLSFDTDIAQDKFDADAIMLGMKWNFGSDSLKSRNRSGASLDPISNIGYADAVARALGNSNNFIASPPD